MSQIKKRASILFYASIGILLLATLFNNCSNQFESNVIEPSTVTSQGTPFSETALRNQLETGTVSVTLAPVTVQVADQTALNCKPNSSIFVAQYLGLSSANTVYGTVVDLCTDTAPSILVSWLSDGKNRIKVENGQVLPVDYILVQGVYRTVYLFHHQIKDAGSSGLFWVTGHSVVDKSYALPIVTADQPVYYQVPEGILARPFQVKPRIVSPLSALTIKSQQSLYAGNFCVLAIGTNLVYEWSKIGAVGNIPNSTPCLEIDSVLPSHSGSYRVRVKNSLGEEFSTAQLVVNETPPTLGAISPNAGMIRKPPTAVPPPANPALVMCVDVVAADSDVLNFSWEEELPVSNPSPNAGIKTVVKSGIMMPSVRQECYTLDKLSLADDGTKYYFKVSNTGGVASTEFVINVKAGIPDISFPKSSIVQIDVIDGRDTTLTVDYSVPNTNQSEYTWDYIPASTGVKENLDTQTEGPPGTSSSYPLSNLSLANDGDQYIFTLSNLSGDVATRVFNISVGEQHIPPNIIIAPQTNIDFPSGRYLKKGLCFVVEGYPLSDHKIYRDGVLDTSSTLDLYLVSGGIHHYRACLILPGGVRSRTKVAHSGLYRFEFQNDSTTVAGQVDRASAVSTLEILDPVQIVGASPTFGSLPDLTLAEGTSIGDVGQDEQFCVQALGSDLEYAWARSELTVGSPFVDLAGQNSNCLNISSANPSHSGQYQVRVSNRLSGVFTSAFEERFGRLVITTNSDIASGGQPPAYLDILPGSKLALGDFCVIANGSNLSYQWQSSTTIDPNGVWVDLAGEKATCLYLGSGNLDNANEGFYRVKVSNIDASKITTSNPGYLNVMSAPQIVGLNGEGYIGDGRESLSPPKPYYILAGSTSTLRSRDNVLYYKYDTANRLYLFDQNCINVIGEKLNFVWTLDSKVIQVNTARPGCLEFPQTTSRTGARISDSGRYTVTVTNSVANQFKNSSRIISQSFDIVIKTKPVLTDLGREYHTVVLGQGDQIVLTPPILVDPTTSLVNPNLIYYWRNYSRISGVTIAGISIAERSSNSVTVDLVADLVSSTITVTVIGTYYVRIENEVGSSYKYFEIKL